MLGLCFEGYRQLILALAAVATVVKTQHCVPLFLSVVMAWIPASHFIAALIAFFVATADELFADRCRIPEGGGIWEAAALRNDGFGGGCRWSSTAGSQRRRLSRSASQAWKSSGAHVRP